TYGRASARELGEKRHQTHLQCAASNDEMQFVRLQTIIPTLRKYYHPPSINIPFLAPNREINRTGMIG
ncbi:hypothetical protein A2U01_0110963, partial [Trifolium medium]|nr:hypothetical protein [Trifolium medium]